MRLLRNPARVMSHVRVLALCNLGKIGRRFRLPKAAGRRRDHWRSARWFWDATSISVTTGSEDPVPCKPFKLPHDLVPRPCRQSCYLVRSMS